MRGPFISMRGPFIPMRGPSIPMRGPFIPIHCPFILMLGPFIAMRGPFIPRMRGPFLPMHGPIYTCAIHIYPCAAQLYPCAAHIYPCAAHLYPCAAHLNPCAANSYPCAAYLYPCAAHLYPCTAHLYPCVAHLYPCEVLVVFSGILILSLLVNLKKRQCQSWKIQKLKGPLSILVWIPYKITKLPRQHSMLGHHRPAGETPFNGVSLVGRWWPAFSSIRILWQSLISACIPVSSMLQTVLFTEERWFYRIIMIIVIFCFFWWHKHSMHGIIPSSSNVFLGIIRNMSLTSLRCITVIRITGLFTKRNSWCAKENANNACTWKTIG